MTRYRHVLNIIYLRTLYNIATAAAAVVAAASASSNAVHMHNNINNSNNNNNNNNNNSNYNKQRHSSISKERNECAKHSELLVAKNRLLTGLTVADVTSALPAAYTPVGAMSSASTPPTQSPAPPNVNKLLCDVLEPEISIRSMYKCCGGGKRFLQQAQTPQQQHQQQSQKQHLHIIQPHAMTNAVATITPPPLTTTTTTSLPTHSTTTCCTPTSSSHHSNCSGCQITAAASIQLANLIGSTMLLPQTAAAMQDVATKAVAAAGATVNVPSEHNASKKLHAANTAENLLCRGGGGNSALEAVSSASAGSSSNIVSPHTAAATTKKANVQFHCEFCAFACSWKYDLKLHLRQKHGIHNKKM
ncbi:probable serine/threonine-protein kinase DDB_G0277165 [Bactrocera neohumeralis]|uniref:probable serine/threonine-protein kinase DDB_G0277165 n=1 Tax=Bactrocera neohumeralis TaxID=98809 RepID=UPI0021667366|nr:probable serine/threonine-protein kinase DDB_G0277165 [Bactrocera neohumeralis]